MTDLDRLIEAVEAGDDNVFRRCNRAAFSTPAQDISLQLREEDCRHAYRGSLDAALSLEEALLPGWEWGRMNDRMFVERGGSVFSERGPNPSRALLLAVLKAYRETRG